MSVDDALSPSQIAQAADDAATALAGDEVGCLTEEPAVRGPLASAIRTQFEVNLAAEYLPGAPQAVSHAIFDHAFWTWHLNGYQEVENAYEDLADLAVTVHKAFLAAEQSDTPATPATPPTPADPYPTPHGTDDH